MNIVLSIIIPFYGHADKRLLERCIDSIHAQNLDNGSYEIIIGDAYREGYGAGYARQQAMIQAKGEYILFVDADDWLFPHTLKPLVEQALKEHYEVLSFNFQEVSRTADSNKRFSTRPKERKRFNGSGADYMLHHNFMGVVWRHLFQRRFLESHALSFTIASSQEDEEFLAKAYFFADRIHVTDAVVYAYYQDPVSISRNSSPEKRKIYIRSHYEMLLRLKSFSTEQANSARLEALQALQRRIRFLTICYFIILFQKKFPISYIHKEMKRLRQNCFLPLPLKSYGWKYMSCALLINLFSKL